MSEITSSEGEKHIFCKTKMENEIKVKMKVVGLGPGFGPYTGHLGILALAFLSTTPGRSKISKFG